MGRTVPAITNRIESKIRQWDRFAKLLSPNEMEAFKEFITIIRNRRTAIDATEEADIGVAILLAAIIQIKGDKHERP